MHDRHYRWQDHVPPTVGMKANLIFAAAFLVAAVAVGGLTHERRDAALVRSISQSIDRSVAEHTSPTTSSGDVFLAAAGDARLLLACAAAAPHS
jgi:hypothetical protein